MNILITIFNYERKAMLENLLAEIAVYKRYTTHMISVNIVDDGSSFSGSAIRCDIPYVFTSSTHGGKEKFWQRWNTALRYCKEHTNDIYIFIPSDFSGIDFTRMLSDYQVYVGGLINILNDGRTTCWNNIPDRNISPSMSRVYFTDCGFICDNNVLETINYNILPISKSRFVTPSISSGVGQQLTERLNKKDVHMFMPTNSYAIHGTHPSTMHPQERQKNPLVEKKLYILQDKDYALGNFVNITPIIQYVYEKYKQPVDVYFETTYVKECYKNDTRINVLNIKPECEPYATTAIVCRNNTLQDYIYAFQKVTGQSYTDAYKPFAPNVLLYTTPPIMKNKYAVILNGTGSEDSVYVNSKNPGSEIYSKIITKLKSRGYTVVFTGTTADTKRIDVSMCDAVYVDDIQIATALVQHASIVVGNDTGLVHIAGCYDVPTFCLWKDTPTVRVQNSGKQCFYARAKNIWYEDFLTWLPRQIKVVVGMATVDRREDTRQLTLDSLLNNTRVPNEIYVYNNDDPENKDITDRGKFYPLTVLDEPVYFFSVDDDIVYPTTYIDDMIANIEQYDCVVTHHGRDLKKVVNNYYTDHIGYDAFSSNKVLKYIDVPGTGVTAFHTASFYPEDIYYSTYNRATDILFGLSAVKKGVKIMLLPHNDNYFKDVCKDMYTCKAVELKNNVDLKNKLVSKILKLKND